MKDTSILSILGNNLIDLPWGELHEQALQIKDNSKQIIDEAKTHNFDPKKYKQIITLLANNQYQILTLQISGLYQSGFVDLGRDSRENNLASLVSLYPHYNNRMDVERLMLANPTNEDGARTTFVHEMFANNCPKQSIIQYFKELNRLAVYNQELVTNYLALSDTDGRSIRQLVAEKSLSEAYLGIFNEIQASCQRLYPQQINQRQQDNTLVVETHTESVHGSVDKSFAKLALIYAPNLINVEASEREVNVTRNAEWNAKIQQDFNELKQLLKAIVASEESIDELLEPTLAPGEDKEQARAQFKFKANAALRLIEGLDGGSYGNHHTVRANGEVSCGLTPKEIVTIGYDSLKNKDLWRNPEQENSHFMQLVENLYIAKRGYNIDRGESAEIADDNKCTGGMVNQVAYGLLDHQHVEVKVITTETMAPVLGKKLADITLNLASSPESVSLIKNWLTTGFLNESLTRLIITELQNDPEFSQEFSQSEIQNIGARVLNKLGQSELGRLREELQNRSPEKFPQDMILSDSVLDKDRVNSFVFEESKGYVPYLEHLYHLDQNRFNNTLQSMLPRIGPLNDIHDNNFTKASLLFNLLLASQDEAMANSAKEMFQAYLNGFTQQQKDQCLILMADCNHVHLLEPLKEAGANVNSLDYRRGHNGTALHYAALYGQIAVIAKLFELGADINAKSNFGYTALHFATGWSRLDAIKELVSLGTDIKATDDNGKTVLHYAAENGYIDAIAKLVELGADINAKDNEGKTALHFAAQGDKLAAIAKLVELGADINAKNHLGYTALHYAAENGYIDVIAQVIAQNSSDIPHVVNNLIKQSSGYFLDGQNAWELIEAIVTKIHPDKRIETVSEILKEVDNTSRRDRLLGFIPEEERNMVRALVSPTLLEAVRETAKLMYGNSSEGVPRREESIKKSRHINR